MLVCAVTNLSKVNKTTTNKKYAYLKKIKNIELLWEVDKRTFSKQSGVSMDWSEEHSVENQQLADDLNVFYYRFEKARLTPSTRSDLHLTHLPTPL